MSTHSTNIVLFDTFKQIVASNNHLCVAYSGGLDSTVLLHLCHALIQERAELQLSAIHVHHGLSPNADGWASHCRDVCDELHIPLDVARVEIVKKSRTSLEQQARDARYKAIGNKVHSQYSVLLAQHQDDQAETYLLQLARGSGGSGLSAMPSEFIGENGHTFLRPLLSFTRESLLQYAQEMGLRWIEDESNNDQDFNRNYLRHSVLPLLKAKWPSISATISRSARHHSQSELVINEYMALLSETLIDNQHRLDIQAYQRLSSHSQVAILRYWLKAQVQIMPSTANLQQIQQIINARQDAQPECRWDHYAVRRYSGFLYLCDTDEEHVSRAFEINLAPNTRFSHSLLPYELELIPYRHDELPLMNNYALVSGNVFKVDFGGLSRRLKLDNKRPSKTLKQWLQEWHVPPWDRAKVPVLSCDEKLVALGTHLSVDNPCVDNLSVDNSADNVILPINDVDSVSNSSIKYSLQFIKKPAKLAGKD